jgi:hypothetical protein
MCGLIQDVQAAYVRWSRQSLPEAGGHLTGSACGRHGRAAKGCETKDVSAGAGAIRPELVELVGLADKGRLAGETRNNLFLAVDVLVTAVKFGGFANKNMASSNLVGQRVFDLLGTLKISRL